MRAVSRCLDARRVLQRGRELGGRFGRYLVCARPFDARAYRGFGDDRVKSELGSLKSPSAFISGGFLLTSNLGFDSVAKGGAFNRWSSFLVDSSPPMGGRPSGDLGYLLKGHVLFSTSSGNVAKTKPVNEAGGKKLNDIVNKGVKNDQVADTRILFILAKYLWLKDNFEFRLRVLLSLGLLVGAKIINVQVPFLFKLAVDWLSAATGSANSMTSFTQSNAMLLALFVSPVAVLVGYGVARAGASACNELRSAVFSKVAQRAIRTVSRKEKGR